MSKLPKPEGAVAARTDASRQVAFGYAVILTVFAVAQLYSFDEFIAYLSSPEVGLNGGAATLLVSLLVVSEVFALPFLLRMALSPAFRWFSMGLSVLAALLLTIMASFIVTTSAQASTVGFLGTAVNLIPGFWAIAVGAALVIVSVWSAWGLWPGTGSIRSVKSREK